MSKYSDSFFSSKKNVPVLTNIGEFMGTTGQEASRWNDLPVN